MKIFKYSILIFFPIAIAACAGNDEQKENIVTNDFLEQMTEKPVSITPIIDTTPTTTINRKHINTADVNPGDVVIFAKTMRGTPYLYASTDPEKGFDCSGFITYVFNHFNIAVPRSSIDFTDVGIEIEENYAAPGDLILFTGTDSTIRIVGHMGIVESKKDGKLQFIHSTSGKAKGVVITPFEKYYHSRFVKFIRIFPEEKFL